MHDDVVVTGMGIVSTIGESPDEFFDSLIAGRSGISRWKQMDPRIHSKVGGDMSDFDLNSYFAKAGEHYPAAFVKRANKLLSSTPLAGKLTAVTALQAYMDAGFDELTAHPESFGHVTSGTNLNARYIYDNVMVLHDEPDFIDPLFGLKALDTDTLSVTSELLNLHGPSYTVGGACASGNLALLSALDLIRSGRVDTMLVTGAAIDLDPVILQSWAIMGAISTHSFNDDPARASRPFDAHREGFVPSQGAGAVVLESLASARARGARIYARLAGAAASSDASRLPKPHVEGQVRAIRQALADAHIRADEVDYINAHATSTPLGDATEVEAIKQVFGQRAYEIPVNSTKSLIGHCVMAAAVVEFIGTILQMKHGIVHATINQEEKDPALDLDFVPNVAREYASGVAISNSFGFGGLNSCVVVCSGV
jgi:3-oxoacyl-(acyl-carrier-protein) synthase